MLITILHTVPGRKLKRFQLSKLFCLLLVLYCVVLYYYFSASTLWWKKDYHNVAILHRFTCSPSMSKRWTVNFPFECVHHRRSLLTHGRSIDVVCCSIRTTWRARCHTSTVHISRLDHFITTWPLTTVMLHRVAEVTYSHSANRPADFWGKGRSRGGVMDENRDLCGHVHTARHVQTV